MIANSIFIGDYLTTKGQAAEADLQMIQDLGFEIERDPQESCHPGGSQPGSSGVEKSLDPGLRLAGVTLKEKSS